MKSRFLVLLLVFTLFLGIVDANQLEINISSDKTWLGDQLDINCWYSGNTSNITYENPWVYIGKTSQNFSLSGIFPNYQISYNPPILGFYEIYCSDGMVNSPSVSFQTRMLNLTIIEIPEVIYLDEIIEIHVKLKEQSDSDDLVTNSVSFKVYLDDKEIGINPNYTYYSHSDGEWIVTTEKVTYENFDGGTYNLVLEGNYEGKESSDEKSIEVREPVSFDVIGVDKTWIREEENITLTVRANNEGQSLSLMENNLKVYVNGGECNILDISQVGDYSYVVVSIPGLEPGTYQLKVRFIYEDIIKEFFDEISYVVVVSGEVVDSDNNGVKTEFKFKRGGEETKITSSSSGTYSGEIPPGEYDLDILLGEATLFFSDVDVDDFDDPLKFDHPDVDADIQGIGTVEIYAFECDLNYNGVDIELTYSESGISDESRIDYVYKCGDWSFGSKKCNVDWDRITDFDIDRVKNVVKIEDTSFSAFAIGYEKNLVFDFGTDKDEYYLEEFIKITGYTEDDDKKPISGSRITAEIKGAGVSKTTHTDENGVFSIELQAPNRDGGYEILLTAEKSPLEPVEKSIGIDLVRSEELSILGPDNLKLSQGDETTLTFSIINTGQTDFSDLDISVLGIPENYYILMTDQISKIKASTENSVEVNMVIPENASKDTYSGLLRVDYGDTYLEKKFLLTISEKVVDNVTTEEKSGFKIPDFKIFPTGKIVLPSIPTGNSWIFVVAVLSFGSAFILKKIKIRKNGTKKETKNFLSSIKNELELAERKKKEEDG